MKYYSLAQLVAGVVLGGIFVWAVGEYGLESPKTIWTALVAFAVVMAVNLADIRAQMAAANQPKSTKS